MAEIDENIDFGGIKEHPNYKEIMKINAALSKYTEIGSLLYDASDFTNKWHTNDKCRIKSKITSKVINGYLEIMDNILTLIHDELNEHKQGLVLDNLEKAKKKREEKRILEINESNIKNLPCNQH